MHPLPTVTRNVSKLCFAVEFCIPISYHIQHLQICSNETNCNKRVISKRCKVWWVISKQQGNFSQYFWEIETEIKFQLFYLISII